MTIGNWFNQFCPTVSTLSIDHKFKWTARMNGRRLGDSIPDVHEKF